MVLQHANRLHGAGSFASLFRLDPARIAACSGAIALNVLVLLLLLVPATGPMLRIASAPRPTITVVDLTPKQPIPPVPPLVPIRHQTPTPAQPRTVAPPDVTLPPTVDPIVVPDGTLQADPVASATPTDTASASIAAPSGPIAGIQLQYQAAPAPAYPIKEMRDGVEGTVMLRVLVDVDGRPLQVDIERSSGNRNLDEAARRAVLKRWMFRPAMQGDRAVQAIGIVPIDFMLR